MIGPVYLKAFEWEMTCDKMRARRTHLSDGRSQTISLPYSVLLSPSIRNFAFLRREDRKVAFQLSDTAQCSHRDIDSDLIGAARTLRLVIDLLIFRRDSTWR